MLTFGLTPRPPQPQNPHPASIDLWKADDFPRTLGDGEAASGCGPITLPPTVEVPAFVDVPPFLQVDTAAWQVAAKAGKPLVMTVDLDPHKAFYAIPPELLPELEHALYPAKFSGTIAAFSKAALANYPKLIPTMQRYGGLGRTAAQADANAQKLARLLIAKEMVFQLYFRLSDDYLRQCRSAPQQGRVGGHPDGIASDWMLFKWNCGDFVGNYRGLTNPYGDHKIYTPLVEGQVALLEVRPPVGLDLSPSTLTPGSFQATADQGAHRWVLTAKWLGDRRFEFRLTKRPRPSGGLISSLSNIGGAITGVARAGLKIACSGITSAKLQDIRNSAGAVPEPNTQGAVQAWQAAATACGLVFPATPTADCAPQDLAPTSPSAPASWLSANSGYLVAGALAVVGGLAVRAYLQRRAQAAG